MNEAVSLLRVVNPSAAALAECASLAARIEPELLRQLRVEVVIGSDVAAEADLWWSSVVEARSPSAIRLVPESAAELRAALVGSGDRGRLARARAVVERMHRSSPPLAALEEAIIYHVLAREDLAPVGVELMSVLAGLLDPTPRADDLAAWVVGSLTRMPDRLRELPAYWALLFAASARGRSASSLGEPPSPATLADAVKMLPSVIAGAKLTSVEALWAGDELWLRRGEGKIQVPDLAPIVVNVGEGANTRVCAVAREWTKVQVGGSSVELRAIDGRTYRLRPQAETAATPAAALNFRAVARVAGAHGGYLVGDRLVAATAHTLQGADDAEVELDGAIFTGRALIGDIADDYVLLDLDRRVLGVDPLAVSSHSPANGPCDILVPPGQAIAAAQFASNRTYEVRLPATTAVPLHGCPLVRDGAAIGHVVAFRSDGGDVCPAFLVAERVACAALLRDLGRIEAAVTAAQSEDDRVSRAEALREEAVRTLMTIGARRGEFQWMGSREAPGWRWLALVAIGVWADPQGRGIVEASRHTPRSPLERIEATRAAEALNAAEPRPAVEDPTSPRPEEEDGDSNAEDEALRRGRSRRASPDEILREMTVVGYPGGFVVGGGERRMSEYPQQVRALNLIYALLDEQRINQGGRVAVLGAGISGLTAAAAATSRGCEVTLIERKESLLLRLARNRTRWLHPNADTWPSPGWGRASADLPLLSWGAGFANTVAEQVLSQWEHLQRTCERPTEVHLGVAKSSVSSVDAALVTWGDHREHFDAVILALGHGEDQQFQGLPTYWDDDDLERPSRRPERCLVSGNGYSGITDLLRLRLRTSRYEDIARALMKVDGVEGLASRLLRIETISDPRTFSDAHLQLIVPVALDDWLKDQLREEVSVLVTGGDDYPITRSVPPLGRLVFARLLRLGAVRYLCGYIGSLRRGMERADYVVDFSSPSSGEENLGREQFDRVLIRWGARSTLESAFPSIADRLASSTTDLAGIPNWPAGTFASARFEAG